MYFALDATTNAVFYRLGEERAFWDWDRRRIRGPLGCFGEGAGRAKGRGGLCGNCAGATVRDDARRALPQTRNRRRLGPPSTVTHAENVPAPHGIQEVEGSTPFGSTLPFAGPIVGLGITLAGLVGESTPLGRRA
jgi:hypothetical protein